MRRGLHTQREEAQQEQRALQPPQHIQYDVSIYEIHQNKTKKMYKMRKRKREHTLDYCSSVQTKNGTQ